MTESLPPVNEALLDAPTLDALVADLLAHAELLDVWTKGGPTARAELAPTDLATAIAALRAGRVRAIQIRYRHGGAEWRDTLLDTPSGVRLVRVSTPSSGVSP